MGSSTNGKWLLYKNPPYGEDFMKDRVAMFLVQSILIFLSSRKFLKGSIAFTMRW